MSAWLVWCGFFGIQRSEVNETGMPSSETPLLNALVLPQTKLPLMWLGPIKNPNKNPTGIPESKAPHLKRSKGLGTSEKQHSRNVAGETIRIIRIRFGGSIVAVNCSRSSLRPLRLSRLEGLRAYKPQTYPISQTATRLKLFTRSPNQTPNPKPQTRSPIRFIIRSSGGCRQKLGKWLVLLLLLINLAL